MVLAQEANQAQIERILQNKNLRLSEVQRRLLSYLAERSLSGDADDLKEYTIGIDAFGKPPSYDPRQESVVRMHVARLRQKLAEYYRTEGAADPIFIDLPKGGFKVTFEQRPVAVEEPVAIIEPPRPVSQPWISKKVAVAAAAGFIALAGAGYVLMRPSNEVRALTENLAGWTPELQQLWMPLLSPTRPLVLCIANPTFGTASGAFRLGQFLGSRKPDLMITRGDQLSMPEIAMNNLIFLGPPNGNRQIQSVPVDQQIVLEPGGIRNLHPRAGEPAFVTDRGSSEEGKDSDESYALISHTPALYGSGDILSLSGNQVSSVMAAVKAFTDPLLARTLVDKLRTPNGLPRYYQVVLRVESMDEMPVKISYLFHRELNAAK